MLPVSFLPSYQYQRQCDIDVNTKVSGIKEQQKISQAVGALLLQKSYSQYYPHDTSNQLYQNDQKYFQQMMRYRAKLESTYDINSISPSYSDNVRILDTNNIINKEISTNDNVNKISHNIYNETYDEKSCQSQSKMLSTTQISQSIDEHSSLDLLYDSKLNDSIQNDQSATEFDETQSINNDTLYQDINTTQYLHCSNIKKCCSIIKGHENQTNTTKTQQMQYNCDKNATVITDSVILQHNCNDTIESFEGINSPFLNFKQSCGD